jgi:hypothetical protein
MSDTPTERPQTSSLSMHGVADLTQKSLNPKLDWKSVMRSGRVGFGITFVIIAGTLYLAGVPAKEKREELERLNYAQRAAMVLWNKDMQEREQQKQQQK